MVEAGVALGLRAWRGLELSYTTKGGFNLPRSSGPSGLERIGTGLTLSVGSLLHFVALGLRAWRGLELNHLGSARGSNAGSSGPSGLERIGTMSGFILGE